MLPLPPPVFSGNTPVSSDFNDPNVKDKSQQVVNTTLQHGSASHVTPGVVLTTDSLDIPLEVMSGIRNQKTESSRPSLMPIFRSRYVEAGRAPEVDSTSDYQELRNALLARLGIGLEAYEKAIIEDQDLDMIATDQFLLFAASQKAYAKKVEAPPIDPEGALQTAEIMLTLPNAVKENILTYAKEAGHRLADYLEEVGPNQPGYDLLLNALNQLTEAKDLIKGK